MIPSDFEPRKRCLLRQHQRMKHQLKVVVGFLLLIGAIIAGAWELMQFLLRP